MGDTTQLASQAPANEPAPPGDATNENAQPGGQESEQKPSDQGQEAQPKAPDAAPALPVSADDYKLTFAPETKVDTELLGQFQKFAHANKIPLSEAQALASAYEKMVASRNQSATEAQSDAWLEQVMNDPDFARDKDANIAALDRVMAVFGTAEAREELNRSGLGNNPALVKIMVNIGKALKEPEIVRGVGSSGAVEPDNEELIKDAWTAAKG